MYTCPCCGYRVFPQMPGSFEICHVCFWEDDPAQLLDPWYEGGANRPSLVEAQANFRRYGAMEKRFVRYVKGPRLDDRFDPGWRLVAPEDRARVGIPAELTDEEEGDLGVWYYWVPRPG